MPDTKPQSNEDAPRRTVGRPPKPLPESIPDTPENVARALLNTPPQDKAGWEFLREGQ